MRIKVNLGTYLSLVLDNLAEPSYYKSSTLEKIASQRAKYWSLGVSRAHTSNMTDEKHDKVCQEQSASASSDQMPVTIEKGTQVVCDAAVNKNGIRLHPQPTSDPLDPLNWSSLQKHAILSIVMLK